MSCVRGEYKHLSTDSIFCVVSVCWWGVVAGFLLARRVVRSDIHIWLVLYVVQLLLPIKQVEMLTVLKCWGIEVLTYSSIENIEVLKYWIDVLKYWNNEVFQYFNSETVEYWSIETWKFWVQYFKVLWCWTSESPPTQRFWCLVFFCFTVSLDDHKRKKIPITSRRFPNAPVPFQKEKAS